MTLTPAQPDPSRHALTSQQARVWASGLLNRSPIQHVYACALPVGVTFPALTAAVRTLAARHTALRTLIGRENARLYQCADGPLPVLEFRQEDGVTAREAVTRLCTSGAALVDVTNGPSARFVLVHGTDEVGQLVVVLHSAVADGWSRMIILSELDQIATERPAGNELRPVRALGYLGDRGRRWRSTADYDRRLQFWACQLAAIRPDPVERAPAGRRTGTRHTQSIETEMAAAVRNLSRERRIGQAAVYLSALCAACADLTGAAMVPICLLTSGRDAEIGTSVGVFANHVPMPVSAQASARMNPEYMWEIITRALRNEVPLPDLLESPYHLSKQISEITFRGIGFQMAPSWPPFHSLIFHPITESSAPPAPFSAIEVSVRRDPGSVCLDVVHDQSRCSDELAGELFDRMIARLAELSGTRLSFRPPIR